LDGNGDNIGGIRGNGGGGILYSTTSDRRLKQNIKSFDNGLATLEKINPAIYQRKSNPGQDEIGFIAQELQEVLPIVVGGSPTDDVNESPMTVDYGRLTPVLVAAIKEQQVLIEQLTKRLNQQDKQYNELRAEISKLQGVAQK
jgi:DNA-binding transcriptional MerR regulator